jgi:3-hydroxyisobutyrate dehydrogenase-like beta-hydroxyacid dehydrogenase
MDLRRFFDVVNQSGARSVISDVKGEKMLARDSSPDFSLRLALKDLTLAQRMFSDPTTAKPLLDAAAGCYKHADAAGFGGDDASAVYAWFERRIQQQS